MTTTFVTTDIAGTFTIAATDDVLDVLQTGIITSPSYAISSGYACQIDILGEVAGGNGFYGATASSAMISLYVGASGSLSGSGGGYIAFMNCNFAIENHGAMFTTGAYADGLYLVGSGAIVNYGSISATYSAIISDDPSASLWTLDNYGQITGGNAFYGFGESDRILNAGIMDGYIKLGTGAGGSLVNSGTINGGINAPNGFSITDSGVITGTVYLSQGAVDLNGAQISISGADDAISFVTGSDVVRLTGGWNNVTGSGGTIYENGARTSVLGGSDKVLFTAGSSGNVASLYDTMGAWDTVYGSGGLIIETVAQASVLGGSDTINFAGGAGSQASLYNTNNAWDTVNGSNGTVMLTSAQASVVGGSDTIYFSNGASNVASLYSTSGKWDAVNGANGAVLLTSAQASVLGGGDTVTFAGGSNNQVSLYNTNGIADVINGSNGTVIFNGAQATVANGSNTLDFAAIGGSIATIASNETLTFASVVGATQIFGFGTTDQVNLSAAQFGSSWSAFLSGDVSQSGANTLITDPNNHANQITLVGVVDTSLVQANFHFT
jgi:hypothetical protein